ARGPRRLPRAGGDRPSQSRDRDRPPMERERRGDAQAAQDAHVRLGIISDTHGLLRPEGHEVFREADRIIQTAGVGEESILEELALIAPLTAVYGNTDGSQLRARLSDV